MRNHTIKTFHASDVDLNYAEFEGDGPKLVISHGFTGRWQSHLAYIERLTDWHIYAVDNPGHGLSGERNGQHRFIDFAKDMSEFIDNVTGSGVAYFGASLGGVIGMVVAGTRPELIKTLALGDIPVNVFVDNYEGSWLQQAHIGLLNDNRHNMSLEELKVQVEEMMPGIDDAQAEFRAVSMSQLRHETSRALAEGTQFDGVDDVDQLLRNVEAPTLMLQGDTSAGGLLSDEEAENMKSLFRDFETEKYPGMSHSLDYTDPSEPFAKLAEFFDRRHG